MPAAAGVIANTHGVVRTRAGSKGQGRLCMHWHLQGPGLAVCTAMAAGSHHQHVAVEPTWDWAKGTQVHIWRG